MLFIDVVDGLMFFGPKRHPEEPFVHYKARLKLERLIYNYKAETGTPLVHSSPQIAEKAGEE